MKKQLLLTIRHTYRYVTSLILMLFLSISAWAIPPLITAQPTNQTVCATGNAYLAVNASYTTSYQWQVSTGGAYSNVTNGGVYAGATTNGLQINGAPASMNGYTYRCICTGPDAPAATSNVATLTVQTPASISVNPAINTNICNGDNTSYTVTASGSNLTYLWYGHNGVTYVPLTNSGFYSGVTTSTLSITGITTGTTATTYSYYCIVSGPCNNVSTPTLYLNVNARPTLTSQPTNSTVCVGSDATFQVAATGTNLSYQWEVSYGGVIWTPLTNTGGYANVTTSLMKVTTTVPMHGSRYRCVVSGDCTPAATSSAAVLSLNNTLNITGNPTNKTICPNASTSFVVSATGSALTYQWQVNSGGGWSNLSNSGIYSDVTTTSLKLTGASAAYNNYKYRCIVNGSCSLPTASGEATLTFYSPAVVTSNPPALSTVCDGDNFSYTVGATGSGLTYQWYGYNGTIYVPLTNTSFYTGVTTPTLNITGITSNVGIKKTYSYFCEVVGTCNVASTNTLYLDVNALPALTAQPENDTTCLGNDAFFEVSATGTNLTYQWQVSYNGVNWANLTNTGGYANVTTRNMKVTTISSMHGTRYRCIVSGACTPSVTSGNGLLTIENPLSIVSQPTNKLVCPNASTSFGVIVTGDNLTYQWQVNTGGSWTNLSNAGVYSDVTTNLLKLTNIPLGYHNYKYRCLVNGKCSLPTLSGEAVLTLYQPAVITSNPTSPKTICDGDNSSFTIAATGSGLSYQWYISNGVSYVPMTNGGFYSGVTTPTLTITGITTGTSSTTYSYFCFVTSTCNTVQANTVYLNVNARPAITSQPVNDTVCSNTDASFQVSATGTNLTYQWQVSSLGANWTNLSNGGAYANVTTSNMKVTATPGFDGFMYRCIVSGACTPSVTSASGRLTVQSQLVIQTQPSNQSVCPNSNASFGVTASGTDLVYQWQVFSGGWVNLTNTGIYSGATTRTLTLTNVTSANNNGRYRCLVSGKCSIPVASAEGLLTVNIPPTITVNPATNTTICDGDNTSYTVSATGTGLTYQWHRYNGTSYVPVTNTGFYSGATTPTLNITGITSGTSATTYSYFCVVSGTCSNASTATLYLVVNARPAITAQPANKVICSGGSTTYSVSATGTGISYQWQTSTNGITWTNLSNTGIYNNVTTPILMLTGATTAVNGNQYRCMVSGACTPPAASNGATLTINTSPAITAGPANKTICENTNTTFSVTATGTGLNYQWQVNDGNGWANVTNSGIYTNATTASLSLTGATSTQNGCQYRCAISGTCAIPVTSAAATLNINTAPVVTSHPVSAPVCPGANTTFSITATGTNLTYQWEVNTGSGWVALSNTGLYTTVTTPILMINGVQLSQNGYQFRCVVSGTCTPAATSNPVTFNISNLLPTVTTQPVNTSACLNSSTSFSIAATGTGISYQWQVSTNGGSVWSAISNSATYSGVATNTLGIAAATAAMNNYRYRCMVSGTCAPAAVSDVAILLIDQPTAIGTNPTNKVICENTNTSFSVAATGAALTYQWQVNTNGSWTNVTNTGVYTGATTNTLLLSTVPTSFSNYEYRCIVGGICTPLSVTSSVAKLGVNTQIVINTQPPATTTVCSAGDATITIGAIGTGITYQWQIFTGTSWMNITNTGIYSDATTATLKLTGVAVTNNNDRYRCLISGTCGSTLASTDATLKVNAPLVITSNPPANTTICSGDNASYTVVATGTNLTYQWYIYNGTSYVPLTNGGFYSGATTSTLNITGITTGATATTNSYFCVVVGPCINSSSNTLYLTVNVRPSITTPPVNSTICSGGNTQFTVSAAGTALAYQWQVSTNGVHWTNLSNTGIYNNVTTPTLMLTGATTTENGYQYRCNVTGACTPSVPSSPATLTVNTAPIVTASPLNKTICEGATTTFSVTATGAALVYKWQEKSATGWADVSNTGIYSGAATPTLTLTAASAAVNGYKYRCIVSGACVVPATSAEATLTVNSSPVITANPINTAVCPSGSTTLSITATGTNLVYSWEVNTGSSWVALSNTGLYSTVNTPTLTITNALVSQNGYQFRCRVTGACTPSVVSSAATLTFNTVPAVTLNPVNTSVCLNGNTTLTAMGTGTGVGYQWQVSANGITWVSLGNTSLYSGVTTNTLGITSAISSINGYKYRCLVTGTCTPSSPTTAATLTVNQPTVLTNNPANSTICENANTSFNVVATGSALGYQWQENTGSGWASLNNGGMYAGATSSTLSLTNVPVSYNTYQYRCIVTGLCATTPITSNAAALTVNSKVVVNTQPSSPTICSGGSTSLSVAAAGTGLSYQWYRYNGTSYIPVTNTGVHTGATTSTLVVTGLTSSITTSFGYYCVVTGTCNQMTTNTVNINVNALPVVTSNPASVTTCDSSDFIEFNVAGTGAGLTYQWQVNSGTGWSNLNNGTNVTGATTKNMKLVKAYFSMNGYQYRCVVGGTCAPSAVSSAATLTVTPLILPTVTIQANNTSICAGTAVNFTANTTNGGSTPAYQWKVNGMNVGTNSSTFTSSSLNNNDQVGCVLTSSYSCPSRKIVNSNVVMMNVTANALPTAVVSSSLGDTVCSGISDTFNVATTFAGAAPSYQWQLNGVDVGSNVNNYITDSLKDTDVVRCILTSNYVCLSTNIVSSNNLEMSVVPTTTASVSIALAADTNICRGVAVTLTAAPVNGGATPAYQWIKNGVDIAGQIFPIYLTSKINTGDEFAVRLTSSRQCVVPVQSNPLKFTVDRPVQVGIDIAVSFNGGNSYTFTAIPENGGTNPEYAWDVNGAVVPNNTTPVFTSSTLKSTDKVRVRMTSNHPCVFNARSVYSYGKTTGIGGQETLITDLTLYPNPNTGKFTITGQYAGMGTETATITIVNTLGQLIHTAETKIVSGKLAQEVNLNGDPVSGVYIMRIQIGDKQEIRRFNITK